MYMHQQYTMIYLWSNTGCVILGAMSKIPQKYKDRSSALGNYQAPSSTASQPIETDTKHNDENAYLLKGCRQDEEYIRCVKGPLFLSQTK